MQTDKSLQRYLQADDSVSRPSVAVVRIIPVLFDLLPATRFPLSNGVDGFQVGRVGEHGHVDRATSAHIQAHRRGEVREDVSDGRGVLGKFAETSHFAKHQLESK